MSADRAARDLRRRLVSDPTGRLSVGREELVGSLVNGDQGRGASVDASPGQIAGAVLVHHGIEAQPPVDAAGPGDAVELQATRRYAIQGAVATTVVAAVAGFVGRPLYALVLGIPAALGIALVARSPAALDRVVPKALPRGRLLGVAVAGALALVAFLAVVLPLRASYRSSNDTRVGDQLVREADAAIDAGEIDKAKALLFDAQAGGGSPRNIDDVRAHLVVAQVQLIVDDAFRKDGIYERARRAYAEGRVREAVRLLRRISGFRDADALVRRYGRALAGD